MKIYDENKVTEKEYFLKTEVKNEKIKIFLVDRDGEEKEGGHVLYIEGGILFICTDVDEIAAKSAGVVLDKDTGKIETRED